MLTWLLNFLGGSVLKTASETFIKYKDSQNEAERIRADVAKKQIDNALEHSRLAQQVRLATAGQPEMRALTFLIAAPFVLHAGAVGLDTTFALGWRIAAYPPPFNEWEGAILLSFFGLYTVGKGITGGIAAYLARRA